MSASGSLPSVEAMDPWERDVLQLAGAHKVMEMGLKEWLKGVVGKEPGRASVSDKRPNPRLWR